MKWYNDIRDVHDFAFSSASLGVEERNKNTWSCAYRCVRGRRMVESACTYGFFFEVCYPASSITLFLCSSEFCVLFLLFASMSAALWCVVTPSYW